MNEAELGLIALIEGLGAPVSTFTVLRGIRERPAEAAGKTAGRFIHVYAREGNVTQQGAGFADRQFAAVIRVKAVYPVVADDDDEYALGWTVMEAIRGALVTARMTVTSGGESRRFAVTQSFERADIRPVWDEARTYRMLDFDLTVTV